MSRRAQSDIDKLAEYVDRVSKRRYDIKHILESRLAGLRDDLYSGDKDAEKEATQILEWLFPAKPSKPLTNKDKMRLIREGVSDEVLERLLGSKTGQRRGRPRAESSQHAIEALSLHLANPQMAWREIALRFINCGHNPCRCSKCKERKKDKLRKRPNPETKSCHNCGQLIGAASNRLEEYLKKKGDLPNSAEE